jgi:hypothetical protein
MRTYRFYKDEIGWFIDLKWFPFNRAHLAMVCGADDLLDKISNGFKEVILEISTKPIKNYDDVLKRVQKFGLMNGAVYAPEHERLETLIFEGQSLLWLCPVTLLVFGHYPKNIYFRVKNCLLK